MFSKETYQKMVMDSCARYPEEACGVVLKNGEVVIMENIQSQLHDLDPVVYPRDATNGYAMSVESIKFIENSFLTNNPVVTIYHSHPDVGAYFSREDEEKSLYGGELIFPVNFLVFDVQKKVVKGAKLFEYLDYKFTCIAVYENEGKQVNNAYQE